MDQNTTHKTISIVLIIVFLGIIIASGVFLYMLYKENLNLGQIYDKQTHYQDSAEKIAKQWVQENAPTYKYDGSNLKTKDVVFCAGEAADCQKVTLAFESAHGGYGDRSSLVTTQVITLHTIVIKIENNHVVSAITDEKFDEMTGEFIVVTPEKTILKVYFPNTKQDPEVSCDKVFAVERTVDKTIAPARKAIEELLKGPTREEAEQEFYTTIPKGVTLLGLTIVSSTAKADFSSTLEKGVAGSCMVTSIRKQIEETLKQFDTVSSVIISINGRTEDILQP